MFSDPAQVPLIGRIAQLQALRFALHQVAQGETGAVFLTGDSGVGKTRLLAAATAEMRTAGAVVLGGTCLDIGEASPLHPLRQAVQRFQAATDGPGARELLAALDESGVGPDGAGALLERVARGLREVSEGRPLVLVVDDLQWADRTTRQLLLYLLAGLGGMRLLVLGAARAEALRGSSSLRLMLLELRRLRSVQVMGLLPLDRAEAEQLATTILGAPPDRQTADLLWVRSGGNPFVLEELAREAGQGRSGVPETLRETVLARVAALPAAARAVVQTLAAGVEPVEHPVLATVTDLPEETLIDAVRTTVDQRILVATEDGYRFAHRLVSDVCEGELLPGEAARLHRRYAETLATRPGGALQRARLAHHWRAAGEPERALPVAVGAAEEAERLHAFAEAYEHWTAALELAAGRDRRELIPRAAEAAHRCGEHAAALRLHEELGGAGSCAFHTIRARYLAAIGRPAEAEGEYERALAAGDCTPDAAVLAAAHSADLLLHLGRYAEAGQRARHALDLAAGADDATSPVVLASAALGFSQAFLDDPVAGVTAVQQALDTAERSGRPDDIAAAHLHLAELLTGPLNRLEDGIAAARRGAAQAARLGLARTYGTRLLAVAVNGLFRVGRWAEAEQVLAEALRHRPAGADAVELLLARVRILLGYGELDAAEQDLDAVATLLAGGGARQLLPLKTMRAGLAMWRGRHADARQAIGEALDLVDRHAQPGDAYLLGPVVWHGLRAEAEARVGGEATDDEALKRLVDMVERINQVVATAARPMQETFAGYRELCSAEVSRIEDRSDPAGWARAALAWDRRGQPYPAAYARLHQAGALFAERTRNADGTAALRAAYRAAGQLGARPLTEEITALAARARVPLDDAGQVAAAEPTPVPVADELSALTGREHQVLAEVAEGMTNNQIAQKLFISERTVGVHVSHILEKLQVRSRVQASAVYLRSQRSS